jgi:hypothetical protein
MSMLRNGRVAAQCRIALAVSGAVVIGGLATRATAQNLPVEAESFTTASGPNGGFIRVPDLFSAGGQGITTGGDSTATPPGSTATYTLNFPAAGTYNLYARFRVLNDDGANDSFFIPNDFGAAPTFPNRINNFSAISTNDRDYYWANITNQQAVSPATGTTDSAGVAYTVPAGALQQTFVVGGRENGFFLDSFLFTTGTFTTAAELDALVQAKPPLPSPAPAAGTMLPGPQGGTGFFGVREVTNTQSFENDDNGNRLEKAAQAFSDTTHPARRVDFTRSQINMLDSGNDGHFALNDNYRSATVDGRGVGQLNNVAMLATGTVRVPTSGDYTFGVNSDDGFRLAIYDQANNPVPFTSQTGGQLTNGTLEFNTGRGAGDTLGVVNLPAGDYKVQLLHFEGNGGAEVELFSAPGAKTTFDGDFNLVGGQARTVVKRFKTVGTWDTFTFQPSSNMASAIAAYNNGAPAAFRSHTNEPTLAFTDPTNPNAGSHGADRRADYPGDTPNVDDDNFGTAARAPLSIIPADAGRYTINVFSDDGFRFRILDSTGNPLTAIAGPNTQLNDSNADGINDALIPGGGIDACCADFIGKYDLAAGNYTMEVITNEQGGGSGLFVYGAFGDFNGFDPTAFQLLGANIDTTTSLPPGLQLVPEPGSAGLLAVGALGLLRRRRRAR